MTSLRVLIVPSVATAMLAIPAAAGETPWQEVAPDVLMRLIASDSRSADGKTWVAVEIDMPADTKTYWRVPGETGIPTRIDLSRSQGIDGHRTAWPYPTRETDRGYVDHAYYGHLVLPIELDVGADTALLHAEILMGVCSDICVPVNASFSLPLAFEVPDNAQALRIRQALAEVPIAWEAERAPFGAVAFDPQSGRLAIEVSDPGFDAQSLIVDVDGETLLFGPPQKSPTSEQVFVEPLGYGKRFDLSGETVNLTFQGEDGPYELVREVDASTPDIDSTM